MKIATLSELADERLKVLGFHPCPVFVKQAIMEALESKMGGVVNGLLKSNASVAAIITKASKAKATEPKKKEPVPAMPPAR